MDNLLFNALFEDVDKMNPRICNGIVEAELDKAPRYIDDVWENVKSVFPPCLEYAGYELCSAEEEYRCLTDKRGQSTSQYDLARSDTYLVKYKFRLNGEDLPPRYFAFPYAENCITFLRDTEYVINPVIADRTFSVDDHSIFLPLMMTKLTFRQFNYGMYADGIRTQCNVMYSKLYNLNRDAKERADANEGRKVTTEHTLAHYLFCKYGLHETFRKYFGLEILVGDASTINQQTCPPEKWHVYESLGVKPEGVRDKVYEPTRIKLAYRKSDAPADPVAHAAVKSMVASMFYVIDRYPSHIQLDSIESTTKWKVTMGAAIFNSGVSHGKLIEDIDGHLASLDMYIDRISNRDLAADNIVVNDIYDLFVHVIHEMPQMVRTSNPASMHGKQLKVLRYVLEPIIYAINNFVFDLCRNKKDEYSLKDIKQMMGRHLRKDVIFGITSAQHGEVSSVSCSNDNLLTKLTTRIVTQADATNKSKYREVIGDSSKWLDSSLAFQGSYTNQPGFDPTGQSKLNTHAVLDERYVLMLPEDMVETDTALKSRFKGSLEIIELPPKTEE